MKIVFIDFNTASPILTLEDGSLVPPPIPRKGEPVYLGERHKQLVKYVRWIYKDDTSPTLDRIEIILE
jgi:hypothetical protein